MSLTSADITFTAGNHRYHIKDSKPRIYIPSVTTICGILDKPFLIQWAANVAAQATVEIVLSHEGKVDDAIIEGFINTGRSAHRTIKDEGANVGTAVHTHVRQVLDPNWEPAEEDLVDGGIEAEMSIMAFDEWYAKHVVEGGKEILLVEQIIVHPDGAYVGTVDVVVKSPDPSSPTGFFIEIIDWKTSNQSDSNPSALYPEYLFQIAAYRRLLMLTKEFDSLLGHHPFGGAQQVSLGKNGQLVVTPIPGEDLDVYADAFEELANILGTYRQAQAFIRAANKIEKQRRIDDGLDARMKEKV